MTLPIETLKKLDNFYKNKFIIEQKILNQVRNNESIIHGQRAFNFFMPSHLDRHTEDYDVFSKNPKKSAKQLEKALEKALNGNFFDIKKGRFKDTYKVVSKVSNKSVADFTKPSKKIPIKKSFDNIKYATIKFQEKKLKKLVKDPAKKFRRDKDKESLKKIKVFNKFHKGGF